MLEVGLPQIAAASLRAGAGQRLPGAGLPARRRRRHRPRVPHRRRPHHRAVRRTQPREVVAHGGGDRPAPLSPPARISHSRSISARVASAQLSTDLLLRAIEPRLGTPSPARPDPRRRTSTSTCGTRSPPPAHGGGLPGTAVHYAVKANPHPRCWRRWRGRAAGSTWPVRRRSVPPGRGRWPGDLVYSNPVKRREDVRFAARLGVRLFVVDSPGRPARSPRPRPAAACCAGSSPRATGRTGRCRGSTAARPARPSRSSRHAGRLGLRRRRHLLPRRLAAARPRGVGAPVAAAARVFAALGGPGSGRGCWISAAGSRPTSRTAPAAGGVRRGHRALTGRRASATAARPRPSSPAAGGRDAGDVVTTVVAVCTAAAPAGSSSTRASSPAWSRPSTRRSATRLATDVPTAGRPAVRARRPDLRQRGRALRGRRSSCRWRWPRATGEAPSAGAYTHLLLDGRLQRLRAAHDGQSGR